MVEKPNTIIILFPRITVTHDNSSLFVPLVQLLSEAGFRAKKKYIGVKISLLKR